jgi:hypothetical protein
MRQIDEIILNFDEVYLLSKAYTKLRHHFAKN